MRRRDMNAARRDFGRRSRLGLLCGVSALALVMTDAPVRALQLASARGGSGSATAQLAAAALASAQQSSAVAQQSMSALLRASQAVAAMQQAQAAARAAAANAASAGAGLPAAPNGLGVGGLQVATGAAAGSSLWQNASLPTQSASNGQTLVNINQQAAQAILTWQTFNVGSNTTLNFNQQGNSNWVALNRIIDPSQRPSQILGSITASGQVYVINPNGIIFGGASQVNVGALVASTASIADSQFLTNGIYSAQINSAYTPSFTNADGAIVVEPGAQIVTNTPFSVTSGGGFVLLMGTQVDNQGTILTAEGQAELAAGTNFVLRPGYSTSANTASTTDGNEIAPVVQNAGGTWVAGGGGTVSNEGYIEADTGDITLAGETIVQDGALLSTTDVNQRGTIHLLNSASDTAGSVTLGPDSLTAILPDLTSGNTAVEAQRAGLIGQAGAAGNALATGQFDDLSPLTDQPENSRVEIVSGGTVEFQGGSLTQVPGGQVAVSAVGRIQVDNGAVIDVAGSNITLAGRRQFTWKSTSRARRRATIAEPRYRRSLQRQCLDRREKSALRAGGDRRLFDGPLLQPRRRIQCHRRICQCPRDYRPMDGLGRHDHARDRLRRLGGGAERFGLQHRRRLDRLSGRPDAAELPRRQRRQHLQRQ